MTRFATAVKATAHPVKLAKSDTSPDYSGMGKLTVYIEYATRVDPDTNATRYQARILETKHNISWSSAVNRVAYLKTENSGLALHCIWAPNTLPIY